MARHNGVRIKDCMPVHYLEADEWDLFDLKKDPAQMRSVYADPEYADVVKNLKTEIETLRQQYGEHDPCTEPQPAKPGK